MLYILAPETSQADQRRIGVLLEAAQREWDDVPVALVGSSALVGCEPTAGDGVMFFDPLAPTFAGDIEALLARASAAGAVLLPVAMDIAGRRPPVAAESRQSFDVVDHLRRRDLQDDQLGVVGAALAREALSAVMPTFARSRLRVFLCHRRVDGEDTTAAFDAALSARHEHVFRDLIDVQLGEQAQERIDDALAGADVLVFLDTPLAGASWWIQHELASALGRGIPVVWVRLGPDDERASLPVQPGAEPHVVVADDDALSPQRVGELADAILRVAWRLARVHARTSQQALRALERWATLNGASIEALDARQRIFQVRHPPPTTPTPRPYPVRPQTDVVQFFGRSHTTADREALAHFLTEHGLGPHDRECRAFDAALMLDPTVSGMHNTGGWCVAEHPERFLAALTETASSPELLEPPMLVLLGAFPAGDYARDQTAPAVQAIAMSWLRRGGSIVTGGHPTFVPLLVEATRLIGDGDGRKRLTIFQSEWFAAPAQLDTLAEHAAVVATPREMSHDASLTLMRRQMIAEGNGSVVVAIGGRTHEGGGHRPGIDEEIRFARMSALPVYLLGAPGGQAALLAARAAANGWSELGNAFDAADNEWLRQTDDYEAAARAIWDATLR